MPVGDGEDDSDGVVELDGDALDETDRVAELQADAEDEADTELVDDG